MVALAKLDIIETVHTSEHDSRLERWDDVTEVDIEPFPAYVSPANPATPSRYSTQEWRGMYAERERSLQETSRERYRVESSSGVHTELKTLKDATAELARAIGNGHSADLFDPSGKWLAGGNPR